VDVLEASVSELVNTAQLLEEYAKRIGALPLPLVLGLMVEGVGFRDTAQLLEEYANLLGVLLMCFMSIYLSIYLSLSLSFLFSSYLFSLHPFS
jgi:hypothetical protein